MHICFIEAGTKEYEEMVALRMKVLLNPIGIPRSYIHPEKEGQDVLIGAFEDRQLTGCCILTRVDDTTVQLRQMAVEKAFQKKGVGVAIVAFAEAAAREKGYQKLMMHARDTVLDFYRKCGYQVVGEQFFEVGIAHHKMEKQLTAS